MTFSFTSLGCKVNQYEVRAIAAELQEYGLDAVAFGDRCDLCVINTCCVTGESEAKSRKVISRARRSSPDGVIAVTGCFAEISGDGLRGADIVVPNRDKDNCADRIIEFLRARGVKIDRGERRFEPLHSDRTRATIKVQDGCDSFCAYCIIPYARGELRSKAPEAAEAEVRALAQNGYREIVVTGIHLTRYGVDFGGNFDLCDLIVRLNAIDGIERIRLGSLEPGFVNEDNIDRLASADRICPHFHLSLQSGCAETLTRMNRPYTPKQYLDEITLLRGRFPDCAITTDIMTGLPGETADEFSQSLDFVRECRFAKAHVFPYSVRPGTAAALMEQVPEATRHERCRKMIALTDLSREEFLKAHIGKRMKILLERVHGGLSRGFTENYIPVSVPAGGHKENEIVDIIITGCDSAGCKGELV